MQAPGRESTVGRVLVVLGLFALALCVRALTFREVLAGHRVFFHGNDAYYHMRRIAWSIAHFPFVLEFDPYVNFPDGAAPIWTPLFDWLAAFAALPFARRAVLAGDLRALEHVAAWVPPLLGAGAVVALYGVLRRGFGRGAALFAALVLCVLSGHVWYSQIGFVDHHVAVAFVATLLLGCGMRLLAEPRRRDIALAGAAAALALATWPGMLLHLALLEAALFVSWAWATDDGAAAARAGRFAVVNGLACALIAPLCAASEPGTWGPFSPVVLSGFQPWLFGVLAALGLACAALFHRGRARGRRRRAFLSVLLGLALLGGSLLVVPGLAAGGADAWDWLSRSDAFQAQVKESLPLIPIERGRPVVDFAAASLSLFFFAVPVALVVFVRWARRQANPAPFFYQAFFVLGLCCVALLQRRFVNSASIAVALLFGWSALRGYAGLAGGGGAGRRRVAAAAVAVVALGALLPVLDVYRPHALALLGARPPVPLLPPEVRRRITLETGEWLRSNTPDTDGWLGVAAHPAWGVLAPWYLGHPLGYASRRPMVANNFGNDIGERNFELAQRYFTLDETAAAPLLERLRVRYVVVDWPVAERRGAQPPTSMLAALYLRNGNPLVDADGREIAPALKRHRLVYESRPTDRRSPMTPPQLKVFEFVAGARVAGRAPVGATVTASVAMHSNRGRRFEYRNRVVAGADGRYRMVLPYANVGSPPGMRLAPSYSLDCGGAAVSLVVAESDVRSGAEIEGPEPCGAGGGG